MNTSVRRLVLLVLMVTIPTLISFGQVSISSDNSIAHSSAMLEVKSTDRGFLPPRVELSGINLSNPVTSPATGLLVYNTATAGTPPNNVIPGYYYWNGTLWTSLGCPQGTLPGEMIYWDGVQWIAIPTGSPGQFLQLSLSGLPTWSGDAYASLTTAIVSSITTTTAISGGNLTSDGGAAVTARGVCWNTETDPTIALSTKTEDGTGTGTFTSNLNGLAENTLYYVRSYATNSVGTSYGNELSFMTLTQPAVTTAIVSDIYTTTATCGGEVTFDGNTTATLRGVCWGISVNPVISGSHTTDGNGEGTFVSNLTGLSEGTLYYVRAYATNDAGTTYGSETSFTTSVADADGNIYTTRIIGTQMWMVENLKSTRYNDDTPITYHTGFQSTSPEYAWYNNDISYKTPYGALYNWYAINTGKLCPTGWHVPADAEVVTLVTYAGGYSVAGGKLKEVGLTHWVTPNLGATDEYGFTALPGGGTQLYASGFISLGTGGIYWTSTRSIANIVQNSTENVIRGVGYNDYVKNSVRCIKN